MAIKDISSTTTTNLDGTIENYEPDTATPDSANSNQDETYWDFPDANKDLGYYHNCPELKGAIDTLAIWVLGKGYTTSDTDRVDLQNIIGNGADTFYTVLRNMFVQMKALGDAFAEIIRKDGVLINLKPLYTGDMRVVINSEGVIIRYEHRIPGKTGKYRELKPNQVLHLVNDRIANEIHGTGVVRSIKWVIDARNEALTDRRKIMHRMIALGILEVDTDDETKIAAATASYQNAVRNGEVLVLPKGTAELKPNPTNIEDSLPWIQYLENFFYQAIKIPRVIATSENYTEASSKVGYLTFEPIYTSEQQNLENQLWNQLGIKIKFNRPASLSGTMQEDEAKNTGQLGFQPSDSIASGRTS